MSRIWRRIPLLCVKDGCIIGTRFTPRRCLSVSARRCDSTRKQEDDAGGQTAKPAEREPVTSAANNLLSALTGLKVKKSFGAKVDRSQKQRSAAADFRDLLSRRKAKDEDGSSAGNKSVQSPEDVQRMVADKAKVVAEIFPEKDVVESELLQQLRRHDEATAAGQQGDMDAVSSILSGIKVERQTALQREEDRSVSHDERAMAGTFGSGFEAAAVGTRVQDSADQRGKYKEPAKRQHRRAAFERHRLSIFTPSSESTTDTQAVVKTEPSAPSLWDKEETKTLKTLAYSTLNSGFDEMMKWTDEGKTWHYPINNEQGLEEEQEIPFQEHLFFDHLLEDLPPIEAIQNFMELVCLGLSKNPYLTVRQKHDHIHWFKTYFKEREGVIREALEVEKADEARGAAT